MIHHSVLIKEGRERFHTQRQQMSGLCHHRAETSVTRSQAEESHSHQKEGPPVLWSSLCQHLISTP